MIQDLETQLTKWQRLLLVFAGAAGVLLITALAEYPLIQEAYQRMGQVMTVSPWFGICFVLLLACLAPGILLLAGRAWRTLPLARRLPVAFGFLACAWMLLLAFDLRIAPLDPPLLLHLIFMGLGTVLAGIYLALTPRKGKNEELFP